MNDSKNIFEENLDNPKMLNPLVLAYIGDSVFDLMVKKNLIINNNYKTKKLHKEATNIVCCQAQAEYIKIIKENLTQEELSIYKRGRNAHTSHTPKQATCLQYHEATGFEALIGYLYLSGNKQRINELFYMLNL